MQHRLARTRAPGHAGSPDALTSRCVDASPVRRPMGAAGISQPGEHLGRRLQSSPVKLMDARIATPQAGIGRATDPAPRRTAMLVGYIAAAAILVLAGGYLAVG